MKLSKFFLFLTAQASVGGQAVLDGVMMRSAHRWAVAIRKPDGQIVTVKRPFESLLVRHKILRLPVLRGVIALGEAMVIGFKTLAISSEYALEKEQKDADVKSAPAEPDSFSLWQLLLLFTFAIGFSIFLFKIIPLLITGTLVESRNTIGFVLLEGALKVSIFCLYIYLIGFMKDMRQTFQYHSAEHKAIHAFENSHSLTPSVVNQESRLHVRCGTAFMLRVFVVAIFVFAIFGKLAPDASLLELVLSRVLFVPLVAGLSFELIKFAGNHKDNTLLKILLAPGLWLQRLTTRPCEDHHCEVAIAALEQVVQEDVQTETPEILA